MSEYRLGDLQLRIMRVLWEQGGATVSEVHEALRRQARRPEGAALGRSAADRRAFTLGSTFHNGTAVPPGSTCGPGSGCRRRCTALHSTSSG